MDCLDRETGQLRLTVGREEDTTKQLGLHKMWMVRCLMLINKSMGSPGNGWGNIRTIETGRLGQSRQLFFVPLQNSLFGLVDHPFHSVPSKRR